MREIKFRAAYDNRVYPVTELMWSDRTAYLFRDDDHENLVSMDDIELLQFTGLHDKNGKDIYEGDIVHYSQHDRYLLPTFEAEVFWKNVQWSIGRSDAKVFDLNLSELDELEEDVLNHLEVIGNIYENPEFLK